MAKHFLVTIAVATATFIAAAGPASAAITTYTSRAAFEAALANPFYLESDMRGPSYSGNGYSYTVDTNSSPYALGNDLSTGVPGGAITFTFDPVIKAFGGYFYNTNDNGDVVSAPIRIQVNDGGAFTYTTPADGPNPSSATSFYGFISNSTLTSASVTATASPSGCSGNCLFTTVGSVIVGTTGGGSTPAPAPVPLLGAAAAFGASRRLRRRLIAGRPVAGRPGA